MRQSNAWIGFLLWRSRHISSRNFIYVLSVIVGIISGFAAASLKWSVHKTQHWLFSLNEYFKFDSLFLVYPLIGLLLTSAFVVYINRKKLGHGLSNIIYVITRKAGVMEPDKMYSHMFTSFFTVSLGGSVGLEAPIVTTGSAIGSNIGRLFHLNYKQRLLLLGCGAAGGISGIFGAPITGVVLVFEVLMLEMGVSAFVPILISSVTSMIVAKVLNTAELILPYTHSYEFMVQEVPYYVLLGVVTGLVSLFYTRLIFRSDDLFSRLPNRPSRIFAGGLLLGILLFIFPPLYGEGYEVIRMLLLDRPDLVLHSAQLFAPIMHYSGMLFIFLFAVILFKMIASSVTISAGGNGGIFAPALFIGAFTGFLFAHAINSTGLAFPLVESAFALVAMAGIMSGTMHAPLTGIFFIAEATSGYSLMLPLMIVSSISYITNLIFEPYSVYTKKLAEKGELVMGDKDKVVLNMLKIKRVVEKDLKTIHPDASLGELVELIKKSKRNIFPVVDEEGKLQGVILLDDIRQIMFRPDMYEKTTVSDLMHAPPGYVDIHDPMDKVMHKFQETGAWNLPVLDGDKYIGFVSKSKIFSIYRKMLIHHTSEE